MFELTDQQKMAQKMFRSWVERHLVPRIDELESGTVPPYDLMRQLGQSLGIFDLARSRFAVMESRAHSHEAEAIPWNEAPSGVSRMARTCVASV